MAAWREGGAGGGEHRPEAGRPGGEQRLKVAAPPDKLNWRRGILVAASILASLVLLALGAVLVFTGTDWGRERVRRYAQGMVSGMIHGRVTIGRLSGNLLTGMTVHNFAITDSAGMPFVAVESFSADYSIMGLLKKHIWLDHPVLVRPLIVLDRPPNGTWNWQRIFARDTTPKPASQQPSWGDWIRFTNAAVVNGQLIVRTPWTPSDNLSPAARDSVVRDALGGGTRLMISRVAGGFQKTVRLDSVTAAIPLLRLADPGTRDHVVEVSSLTMDAFPFRAPGASIRDLKGVFPFNNDSVWWKGAYVAMPRSKASGDGSYVFSSGDMSIVAHTDPATFADMRWVYPRMPDGHGKLDLKLTWRGALQDYQFSNTDVSIGAAHADGSFGIALGDTITIHDTDLRFTDVDTRMLEQVIPHFKSPRRGTFAGRARVHGGRNALAVNGDVRFDDRVAGASRITANGEVGFLEKGGVRARDLKLGLMPVQVALARTWDPTLPIAGTVSGTATVNGSTTTQLSATMNLTHIDRGERSSVEGKAAVRLAGGKYFDVDVTAKPVSLVEVGRFAPSVGLQGSAAGPIRAVGTLGNLRITSDLRLPDGGRLNARGALDLASREKGYDLTAQLYTLNLRTVDSKAPITSLTANAAVRGRGTSLPTMQLTLAADLATSRWDSIAVDTVSVRGSIADGVAKVDKLYALGTHTTANVSGSFGLARNRFGELSYKLAVDSLGALNRWIPRRPGATVAIQPRPLVVRRAVLRAQADSARRDRATELQRMIAGNAPPQRAVVTLPQPVPADTLSGSASAAGTIRGNIYQFDLRGRVAGERVVARGNYARAIRGEYSWVNARTPQAKLAVAVDADSLSAMGFAFDTASARATYENSSGHVELAITQGETRDYGASGDYTLHTDQSELRLANMTFRFDTAYWRTPHPATIQWGGPGVRVTNFELVNRSDGRIYANGLLPTSGIADFRVDVDNFPVSNIIDIVQTDIDATGIITLHATMNGTLANPAFKGAYGVANATYNETVTPDLRGTFAYVDKQLVAHAEAVRATGLSMAVVDAKLPINLAMSGVTGDRLLPEPMTVDLVADSLPLELVPQFTDIVSQVHGRAAGKVSMRGTLRRPVLVGAMTLTQGEAILNATGAKFERIGATVRMANDTVYVDSIAAWAQGPVRLRGSLAVGNWREPALNLYLVSNGAEVMNNERARIRVDAGLALTGPFTKPYLSGAATITQGVIYAPEPSGRHSIGAGDPALFNVLDTAIVEDRDLFPAASPFMQNLRMDVSLLIHHDTWVRNREANIEIYADDPISIEAQQQAFQLTGVVTTDRGEYSFLGKRFQIKRGSAMFIGSPDLNPTLQITGEYQVQIAARGALNISVVIGGTLKRPKLSLESDAQPPKTQSELLSFLAFGQNTTSLISSSSSSIAGSAATLDLFGVGAQMAVRRLASVAVGVMVDNVQVQASRGLGTDVFAITPADIPTEALTGSGLSSFFKQTKIEAGKYINPRTFLSGEEQAGSFGLAIEHRTADGWRFSASWEPRLLLNEPSLDLTRSNVTTRQSFGGFVIREWRF